jgi:DNA-binding NarL/FixJ family response regulator
MINVILAEDHPLVLAGMQSMLAEEGDIICQHACTTGADLMHVLKIRQPDLILMDVNLPDTTGIDLCREVKRNYPGVLVLALSVNNQPAIIRKMIDSGASGYVLKDADRHEIVKAIRAVIKGKEFFSQSVVQAMRKPSATDVPPLTRREKEILEWISNGYTSQQIADELSVDVTTIVSHKKNMLAKYNVKNTAELVKFTITHRLI